MKREGERDLKMLHCWLKDGERNPKPRNARRRQPFKAGKGKEPILL